LRGVPSRRELALNAGDRGRVSRASEPRAVVIVGAGLAGLYAGCVLAARGLRVTVLEKNEQAGGNCSAHTAGGYTFDIGATMLQTPEVLIDSFTYLGRDLQSYLELLPLNPIYRLHFASGSSLEFAASVEETAANIAAFAPGDVDGFMRYVEDIRRFRRTLKSLFIDRRGNWLADYLNPDTFRLALGLNPLVSVQQFISRYFTSPELQAAFSFQVLYFGIHPDRCPAPYAMVPYFEITKGVWHVRGGLNQIAAALTKVLREEGGELRLNAEVARIRVNDRKVRGVLLENGEELESDYVIANADAMYTYLTLVPAEAVPAWFRQRVGNFKTSCGAVVLLLGTKQVDWRLCHNAFYAPRNKDDALRSIFQLGQLPAETPLYVCSATRTDSTLAPSARQTLYVLMPAPGRLAERAWDEARDECVESILSTLENRGLRGLRAAIEYMKVILPSDYEQLFNQPKGMCFGIQPTIDQMGPLRPGVRSRWIGGLYLAGASTNPGSGIPLVMSAGRNAAAAVLADLGLPIDPRPEGGFRGAG
jgi:phytoene desaturase